jgi:hypothetical protein
MRKWLRRHQWNGLSVLGAVLVLWVGPYLYWKVTAVGWSAFRPDPRRSFRPVNVPPYIPKLVFPIFYPLAEFDARILEQNLFLSHRGIIVVFPHWQSSPD